MLGEPIEMIASKKPEANKMGAYERVLTNAMVRDATLFASEAYT
jgi:glucose-6-phosphate 1-dehydrogenase